MRQKKAKSGRTQSKKQKKIEKEKLERNSCYLRLRALSPCERYNSGRSSNSSRNSNKLRTKPLPAGGRRGPHPYLIRHSNSSFSRRSIPRGTPTPLRRLRSSRAETPAHIPVHEHLSVYAPILYDRVGADRVHRHTKQGIPSF